VEYPNNRSKVVVSESGEHKHNKYSADVNNARKHYSWITNPVAQQILKEGVRFKNAQV
jgi:prophage antirepressor-like protein